MSTLKNPQAQFAERGQGAAPLSLDRDAQGWGIETGSRAAARPLQSQPGPMAQPGLGRSLGAPQPSHYPEAQGYTEQSAYGEPSYSYPGSYSGDHTPASAAIDPFLALKADQARAPRYQSPSQQNDVFATGQYAMPQEPALSTYKPRTPTAQPQTFDHYGASYGAAQQDSFTAPESYAAPAAEPFSSRSGAYGIGSAFDHWPAVDPHADPQGYTAGLGADQGHGPSLSTGYDDGAYQQPSRQPSHAAPPPHWVGQEPYTRLGIEPAFDAGAYGEPQPLTGGFDQSYAEDHAPHAAEPPRRKWTKAGALLASTVLLGGSLAYVASAIVGSSSEGPPPVVKTAEGPFKVKPSDPGGKQFAHTDSKVMGRLGDGGAALPATGSSPSLSSSSNTDASGARKVPVLVVNRDGTIQPPPAPSDAPEQQTRATIPVPGMTVIDGLGGPMRAHTAPPSAAPAESTSAESRNEAPIVVSPAAPQVKPKIVAAAGPTTVDDSSPAAGEPEPQPKKPQAKKPAPVTTAAVKKPTGAGYVAVIASVPASESSRIDALKQFADMQQKYGTILQNKTPEVQEANLGERGTFHRLLVGPPGSRDLASQLCSDLKGQGYNNCWVTAY